MLGYYDNEIKLLESERFGRNIANNLTFEQAKDISKIFNDNEFPIYLNVGTRSEDIIFWNQLGIDWEDELPKDHYCDTPLISREHLADLSIPKKVAPPVREIYDMKPKIECPYCHSKDTKKISGFSKAVELGVFGIFAADRIGKQWHCNHCGSDF